MVIARILDGDEGSLEARVARVTASTRHAVAVRRHTHWYTTRPPAYEAVIVTLPVPQRP
jgi:hypothetical protein